MIVAPGRLFVYATPASDETGLMEPSVNTKPVVGFSRMLSPFAFTIRRRSAVGLKSIPVGVSASDAYAFVESDGSAASVRLRVAAPVSGSTVYSRPVPALRVSRYTSAPGRGRASMPKTTSPAVRFVIAWSLMNVAGESLSKETMCGGPVFVTP